MARRRSAVLRDRSLDGVRSTAPVVGGEGPFNSGRGRPISLMPSQKTYLSPEEQWDRTVRFCKRHWWLKDERLRYLAVVVRAHRLALAGDVLVPGIPNGGAERWPVMGVTSKGYTVGDGQDGWGFYMRFARWRGGCWGIPQEQVPCGPVRMVQLPGELASRSPADPEVRDYVLGTLRAGPHAVAPG